MNRTAFAASRHRRLARLVIAGALGCLAGTSAIGQSSGPPQLPTFRGGVRVIEVDAIVRDKDDNFIDNLTKDDFELLEDGRPQDIQNLTMVKLPVGQKGRPLDPAALALTPQTGNAGPGRVYVMILGRGDPTRIRMLASQFVERYLGPTDLMAVLHSANRGAAQGLTNDKTLLLASVDRYIGSDDSLADFRALKEVAVNMNSVSGRRKAVLFLGGGSEDLWAERGFDTSRIELQSQLWREYNEATRTAARNNVRIYPVDPSGLRPVFQGVNFAGERPPLGPYTFGNFHGERMLPSSIASAWIRTGGDSGSALVPRRGVPSASSQSALRLMAEDTGGIAVVNTNNFDGNFGRIVRDNSEYYVLGYYSSADRDGKFHRITVRLKNRPDLTVSGSRAGYTAASPDVRGRSADLPKALSPTAREALRTPAPATGLPLEVFTSVYQADGYSGSILIGTHVQGPNLKLARNDRIELSYAAIDRWGTTRAVDRRAFTLTMNDQVRARVAQSGLRLFGRLQLPRGQYQIRVVAHQPSGETGSTTIDVEVPDYTDMPLSVSELVVASANGPKLTTLEEDAQLRRALPSQPTPARRFPREDTLTLFAEVYDSHWILSEEIGVTSTVTAADGRLISRQDQDLKSANQGRFYFTGSLPLRGLEPGMYSVTVEAFTRAGVPASASQQLRFEVGDEP